MVDARHESMCWRPIISGDRSKVFFPNNRSIQAWLIQTGELVGEVMLEGSEEIHHYYSHFGDGSRLWALLKDSQIQGWDFGVSGSTPILISGVTPDEPHLELNQQENPKRYRIRDKATGNKVFQLSGKYANPTDVEWDGLYLVAGYESGEVLILDFNHILPQ